MAKQEGLSVTLKVHDHGVAEVLNLSDEEIVAWASSTDELPADAEIYDGDLDNTVATFRLVEAAARESVAGGVTADTARRLGQAVTKMLGSETCLRPQLEIALAEPSRDAKVTGLYLGWRVVYAEEDAAYLAPHVVERLIDALETLCDVRRERFAVCKAPRVRAPESECGKLFLARRSDAKYCSDACRTRLRRHQK